MIARKGSKSKYLSREEEEAIVEERRRNFVDDDSVNYHTDAELSRDHDGSRMEIVRRPTFLFFN